MDLAFVKKLKKLRKVKGNFNELIDAPLETIIYNKLEGKESKFEEMELTKY